MVKTDDLLRVLPPWKVSCPSFPPGEKSWLRHWFLTTLYKCSPLIPIDRSFFGNIWDVTMPNEWQIGNYMLLLLLVVVFFFFLIIWNNIYKSHFFCNLCMFKNKSYWFCGEFNEVIFSVCYFSCLEVNNCTYLEGIVENLQHFAIGHMGYFKVQSKIDFFTKSN